MSVLEGYMREHDATGNVLDQRSLASKISVGAHSACFPAIRHCMLPWQLLRDATAERIFGTVTVTEALRRLCPVLGRLLLVRSASARPLGRGQPAVGRPPRCDDDPGHDAGTDGTTAVDDSDDE